MKTKVLADRPLPIENIFIKFTLVHLPTLDCFNHFHFTKILWLSSLVFELIYPLIILDLRHAPKKSGKSLKSWWLITSLFPLNWPSFSLNKSNRSPSVKLESSTTSGGSSSHRPVITSSFLWQVEVLEWQVLLRHNCSHSPWLHSKNLTIHHPSCKYIRRFDEEECNATCIFHARDALKQSAVCFW